MWAGNRPPAADSTCTPMPGEPAEMSADVLAIDGEALTNRVAAASSVPSTSGGRIAEPDHRLDRFLVPGFGAAERVGRVGAQQQQVAVGTPTIRLSVPTYRRGFDAHIDATPNGVSRPAEIGARSERSPARNAASSRLTDLDLGGDPPVPEFSFLTRVTAESMCGPGSLVWDVGPWSLARVLGQPVDVGRPQTKDELLVAAADEFDRLLAGGVHRARRRSDASGRVRGLVGQGCSCSSRRVA